MSPGLDVALTCLNYGGQSGAFNVIPTEFWHSPQAVADIAWAPGTQALLATVPANGGAYSNSLVAIDPNTGLATNSYPLGYAPSEMEISPDGTYLYIAVSNTMALQRFDLTSMTAGPAYSLGNQPGVGPRFAYNFCIPPGFSDSVVVAARHNETSGLGGTTIDGIYRMDSGNLTELGGLSAARGILGGEASAAATRWRSPRLWWWATPPVGMKYNQAPAVLCRSSTGTGTSMTSKATFTAPALERN